ncbi:DNA-binding response regulator, OmpR family, contains REC and winged-helix (wHTH) domain [Ruminococcaceae bacterium YRB3002]|nr:DNA-binding response regulator, OmpR family, contains REC and winged-helix (wHTH) domain [Ruminococcaceae bacterium YRB3002]
MNYRVLVADDEKEIRNLLRLYLENESFDVIECGDGPSTLAAIREQKPDICLLDIMMPGIDGLHVMQEIRRESNIPIMIISARTADAERILGLNLGADDYIPKPFNPLEVVARVKSNIRRFYDLGSGTRTGEVLKVRELELDTDSCLLTKDGTPVELTSVEYRIMEMFMRSPGKVFTKQQIYEYAWGDEYVVADNNIMVSISKLRTKLDDDPSRYIKTLRGLGYRLDR